MPCEVVLYRVDFFKMAAVAMETAKMLKNWKTQKWSCNCGKVYPTDSDLAYLAPLAVDVVPIKFHQFLFGE
jgi:hypothetical protein